jgi:2',3'-cyclic-nucleotide 2'-phosphodiesterase (5'-nucleotidase family)
VHITDVYKLDNFPSLRTLIKQQEAPATKVVSILTGDFLAPYLLSAIDKGRGMVQMLNETPIGLLGWVGGWGWVLNLNLTDYVTFGNHEDDLEHEHVCQRVRDYIGVWINSNMQEHEMFKAGFQKATEMIKITSPDGTNNR